MRLTLETSIFHILHTVVVHLRCVTCQEKGRYEVVQGQLKLPEEMAEFWQDIIRRYPAIILIIDPVRKVVSHMSISLSSSFSLFQG